MWKTRDVRPFGASRQPQGNMQFLIVLLILVINLTLIDGFRSSCYWRRGSCGSFAPLSHERPIVQKSTRAKIAEVSVITLQAKAVGKIDEPTQFFTKGLPDKSKFSNFYKKTVRPGAEMTMDQFITYENVASLLADRLIFLEDVEELWISAIGDAQGLNNDEAYEMLCMIEDLPDPEDIAFLDKSFQSLTGGKGNLSFYKFISWSDIQDIMNNDALTMEEITDIWRDIAGDLNTAIDRKLFGAINNAIDDALDEKEDDDENLADEDGSEIDLTGVNIWDPSFEATSVFDKSSLNDIKTFFESATKGSIETGKLKFANFLGWNDIQEMLDEGAITIEALEKLWREAPSSNGSLNMSLDYDTFIRLNVKLDLLLDEIESEQEASTSSSTTENKKGTITSSSVSSKASTASVDENDAESYYRTEFKKITQGGNLMRLDMLLEWKEIKELISEKTVTENQITRMFEGLPKEPMGLPATAFGITESTFVAFNGMLDVLLDAASGTPSPSKGESTTSSKKGVTPSSLVSEPARPMPSDSELKIGSLGPTTLTDNKGGMVDEAEEGIAAGLSESEMELMNILDKADNMLNTGSFSDFDQLIGDVNDPRLQALREKRDGAEEVRGELKDILDELLRLSKQQKRCGLDKPEEEVAARIRDLIQAVIEKSPKMASKDISQIRSSIVSAGKWKLLYTNSEMFDFYNGVTGFANVFPASKFENLAMEYRSDGYLSESKYFETLNTPMGKIDATVFADWELAKEMSFMTNENSVILRNYCKKVTAGPMEYLAEENWKSLRTVSMNELLYVDDKIKIMRNCGALRIYFVFERVN